MLVWTDIVFWIEVIQLNCFDFVRKSDLSLLGFINLGDLESKIFTTLSYAQYE